MLSRLIRSYSVTMLNVIINACVSSRLLIWCGVLVDFRVLRIVLESASFSVWRRVSEMVPLFFLNMGPHVIATESREQFRRASSHRLWKRESVKSVIISRNCSSICSCVAGSEQSPE